MGQGIPRSGRPASVNLPRPRLTPLESLGPFPDTETKPTAADEAADELDGAVGGSHAVAGPNGFQIPPREHTERERLAMRPEIRGELGSLIDELRGIFERDRGAASQSSATRCGICYLHHPPEELEYRESEGFYVCERCSQALRGKRLPMIRRQQR